MLKEYLVKKALDLAFARATDTSRTSGVALSVSTDDLEAALSFHLREVKNWSSEISFADLRSAKSLPGTFIPLNVYRQPRRKHLSDAETHAVVPLESVLAGPTLTHVVLLGQPGAGKTTSMKHLCYRLLHDESFLPDRFHCPLLIRLRDLNTRTKGSNPEMLGPEDILFSRLQTLLGIRLAFPSSMNSPERAPERQAVRDRVVIDVLDSLRALVVLDGLDELAHKTQRDAVLDSLRTLAHQLEQSLFILTSRSGALGIHIEGTDQFELCPLEPFQVSEFACRWLGEDQGVRLLTQLATSPFADTAIRPLTLAHLCAIFERIGTIPERPKTVYRKIVNLLLEEWDQQRSVSRTSGYAGFEIDRKFEFLAHLAFVLTTKTRSSIFSKTELAAAYASLHENFGLPATDGPRVVDELESHTGLFVQAGYERFEFSHRSLQEYLAAEFIVKLPSIPADPAILGSLANELAIAVAISSSPSLYFAELVCGRLLSMQCTFEFVRTFVSRLLLERPDFDRSPRVGAALLSLYSLYLEAMLGAAQKPLLFVDYLLDDFQTLAAHIRDRVDLSQIMGLYEEVGRVEGIDGRPVTRIRMRQLAETLAGAPDPAPEPSLSFLPRELLLGPALIDSGPPDDI